MKPETLDVIARTWRSHLSFDGGFVGRGVSVQTRPASDTDAWLRFVRLGDATAATVPVDCQFVEALTSSKLDLADPSEIRTIVPEPSDQLGPAELLFFDPSDMAILPATATEAIDRNDPALDDLLVECADFGAGESGLDDVLELVSVIKVDSKIVAACSWELWPPAVAHICVLVHPDFRGQGLSKLVAVDATRRAIDVGLVPQWRAREGNVASAALARSIGYELLGRQLSILP